MKRRLPGLCLILSLAGLAGALALPSGVEAWFDGLPWSRRPELVVAAVLLPLLLILQRDFLATRVAAWGALLLLALKLVLALAAPAAGWNLWAYADLQHMQKHAWQPTYATIWRPGVSQVLDKPLSSGREFPIEWLNQGPLPPKLTLGVRLAGWARVPPGQGLVLMAGGLRQTRAWVQAPGGPRRPLPILANQPSHLDLAGLPSGVLRVEAELLYGQGGWSLVPMLAGADGSLRPAFKQGVLWRQAPGAAQGDLGLSFWTWAARAADAGLLLWLATWALMAAWRLWQQGVLDWISGGLALAAWLLPDRLHGLLPDPAKLLPLGGALVAASAALALAAWWQGRRRDLAAPGLRLALVLAAGMLPYFLELWGSQVGRMHFYSLGDDWHTYQSFARAIFVGGDWWHQAQGVFTYQPMYRYVVGLLHTLFGQSPLAQNLLDVWAVLGGAGLLAALGAALGLRPAWALAGAGLYVAGEMLGPFRHHLGRGLQEHAAMLAMMLAAWAAARGRQGGWGRALGAGLLAALAYGLRQDHVGVLAGLGLLALAAGPGGPGIAWPGLLAAARQGWTWLALYWGVLAAALLALALRNYVLGGALALTSASNFAHLGALDWHRALSSLTILLLASQGPASWTAWLLIPGVGLGLLALFWRPGPLADYPLALGISLAGLLSPYLFLLVNAYPPRFSQHLLPLACLSLVLAVGRPAPPALGGEEAQGNHRQGQGG